MYIKQVVIQGFKSYKDQTVVDPFSPGHNVVVGENGSGKSNFFDAIRFVLSDLYSSLRVEERQQLLHEGAGVGVMTAFVELIFDNTDGRLPIDRDEVVLRRSIGLKKDDYYLDKRHVTKSDVVNLLESAGFSRSNPYYIVQQGKVNALTMMKDPERLELLKDIAGTRVYDERRAESQKIMHDTDERRVRIAGVLEYIQGRLNDLDQEKDELRQYQVLDRERRALEYAIYDQELQEALAQLEELEAQRHEVAGRSNDDSADLGSLQDTIRDTIQRQGDAARQVEQLRKDRELLQEERQDEIRARAQAELDLLDAQQRVSSSSSTLAETRAELQDLRRQIAEREAELAQVEPVLQQVQQREQQLQQELAACERDQAMIYGKQGRGRQFASAEERDSWLRHEIKTLESAEAAQRSQLAALQRELRVLEKRVRDGDADAAAANEMVRTRRAEISECNKTLAQLKSDRDAAIARRRDTWRSSNQLEQDLQGFQTRLTAAERELQAAMPKSLSAGLASVKRLAAEHKISGVCGPVIELLQCDEAVWTAVEVTGGNSLFDVVVENDQVATKLIRLMNASGDRTAGRVTFAPLNRVSVRDARGATATDDAVPLLSKLRYDHKYDGVMRLLFGKTLICRNLVVAAEYARTRNLNCVTLDGDQVNRKGALTGGFHDSHRSRLRSMNTIRTLRAEIERASAEARECATTLSTADAEVSRVLSEIQKTQTAADEAASAVDQAQLDMRVLAQSLDASRTAATAKAKAVAELEQAVAASEERVRALNAELGTELSSQVDEADQARLAELTDTLDRLQRELIAASEERAGAEIKATRVRETLQRNLEPRLAALQDRLADAEAGSAEAQVEAAQQRMQRIQAVISDVEARLDALDRRIDDAAGEQQALRAALDDLRQRESAASSRVSGVSKQLQRLQNKRSLLLGKADECRRRLGELGSPPRDAADLSGQDAKALIRQLAVCNEKLGRFSYVNKKALDQYVHYTEQKEELERRKAELDDGAAAIADLIATLDAKKDDAIQNTFRNVAMNFRDVFSELVPTGCGKLSMLTRNAKQAAAAEAAVAAGQPAPGFGGWSGVAIKVSFTNADVSELRRSGTDMGLLSGGQKSLVALALIFAIQRCDPAAFYLFDEIDAALDAAHRAAVARMIEKQADNGTQFVCTTFRPEFVRTANKHYRVSQRARVSRVDPVALDDALDVIATVEHQ